MAPEEFIARIIQEYQNARLSRYANDKIRRGRSHAISSVAEDLFAYFLVANDPTIEKVYVDQPITLLDTKKIIYPDIVVVRQGHISSLFDLKMDLGWKRDKLFELCKQHASTIQAMRATTCKIRDGQEKTDSHYMVNRSATYNIVIISGRNIHADKLASQMGEASRLGSDVAVLVLSKEMHPNRYGFTAEELMNRLDRHQLIAVCDEILKLA